MRMTAEEKILCPELYHYLRDEMPGCANISKIVNNLVAYGGLTVAEARNALYWGTDPYVYVMPDYSLSNHHCSRLGHAKCAFSSSTPNDIEVHARDVIAFMKGGGMGYTAAGLRVPIVGVALLHALCHWGNHRHKIKETSEQGFAFERATYGRTIG